MSVRTVDKPRVVSREEWIAARKELLANVKPHYLQYFRADNGDLPWKTEGGSQAGSQKRSLRGLF